VVVTSAPSSSPTVNAVVLDGLDVHDQPGQPGNANAANLGHGIWLNGGAAAGAGDITATISNSKVRNNHNSGILIDQRTVAVTTTTRETLTGNDVFNNNIDATDAKNIGGIEFLTPSTLTAFSANKVHSNRRDQIGFLAPQNGAVAWDLRPGTTCTAAINSIYCYSADANSVGLRVNGSAATTVEARNISWANKPPATGTKDFAKAAADTVTLGDATADSCARITTCP
jgi:hypothetical protein